MVKRLTKTGNSLALVLDKELLEQLKIATQIVTITYAALMGAIALGSALAFGLGGREVAGEMLRGAYDKGRELAARDTIARARARR